MARPIMSTPSLGAIAKKLGISIATASRAIHNDKGVSSVTRDRVLAAVRSHGYVIPQKRNSSDEPRNHQIMVLSRAEDGSDLDALSGMSRGAISLRLMLLFHHVSEKEALELAERQYQPLALQNALVDGLVFLRRWPLETVRKLSAITPAVSILHRYPGCATDFVGIDDRAAMMLAVDHLMRGGYRKIGFFGLDRDVSWTCSSYGAFIEVMQRMRAPLDFRNAVEMRVAGSWDEWGKNVLARIRSGVDAWICSNDVIAWKLMRFLLERNIQVPDRVGVVGYHGRAPNPKDLPQLTAVEIVDEELGAAALRLLVHRLAYPRDARQSLLLAPTLLAKASTRPERR